MSADTVPNPEGTTFTDFAKAIAKIARGSKANQLKIDLMKRLRHLSDAVGRELKRGSSPELDLVNEHYKIVLGLGLLIACAQSSARRQKKVLDATLLAVATSSDCEFCQWTRDLVLTELTYVDQFLIKSGRCDVREHLSQTLLNTPAERNWNPPLRDYMAAKLPANQPTHADGPTVFLVGSVKGGVGKSLCSAAMLSEFGKTTRTVLIDLDSSGPTAQFHFNSRKIARALSPLPSRSERDPSDNKQWLYGTSADVFLGEEFSGPLLKKRIEEAVYPIVVRNRRGKSKEDPRRCIFVLPDSITLSGRVNDTMRRGSSQAKTALALEDVIHQLHDMGFTKVILDLGTGLSAVNGTLLNHLTRVFRTKGVFLASPRLGDLVTSLYEASWMAAQGEYHWDGPLLHVTNMWPEEYSDCDEQLCRWINRTMEQALQAAVSDDWENPTSGAQIISWRLWSVLYLVSVPSRFENKRLLRKHLPYDAKIRKILNSPVLDDQPSPSTLDEQFLLDTGKLENIAWYTAFRNHIAEWLEK